MTEPEHDAHGYQLLRCNGMCIEEALIDAGAMNGGEGGRAYLHPQEVHDLRKALGLPSGPPEVCIIYKQPPGESRGYNMSIIAQGDINIARHEGYMGRVRFSGIGA